ncbi:hypothetical protein GGF31_005660 [Allomyces arbusculus]|nr:hypothetical protein GGF31_005660 [Allomyces arbusculus]
MEAKVAQDRELHAAAEPGTTKVSLSDGDEYESFDDEYDGGDYSVSEGTAYGGDGMWEDMYDGDFSAEDSYDEVTAVDNEYYVDSYDENAAIDEY